MRAITLDHQAIPIRLQRFKWYQDKPIEKFRKIDAAIPKQIIVYDQTAQKSMKPMISIISLFIIKISSL